MQWKLNYSATAEKQAELSVGGGVPLLALWKKVKEG